MRFNKKTFCALMLVFCSSLPSNGVCQQRNPASMEGLNEVFEFLDSSSRSDLGKSKFSSSLNTSIFSAWDICKRESIDTSEENCKREFIGFVEGRLNAPTPEWWREKILEIGVKERIERPSTVLPDVFSTKHGVSYLRNTELLVRENRTVECFNSEQGKVLEFSFEKAFGENGGVVSEDFGAVGICRTDNGNKIVCFNSPMERKRKLLAFGENGEVLFASEVSLFRQKMLFGRVSPWQGCIEVQCRGDLVFVFSCDGVAISLDVYSLSSNDFLLHFTTFY